MISQDTDDIGSEVRRLLSSVAPSKLPVMLSCCEVWKLYGDNVTRVVKKYGRELSDNRLHEAQIIGAVRDVSLDIRRGEIFVIMGLSGSGKSTLLRCMTGLIEPTLGCLLIDGTDLMKISKTELVAIRRHMMGMVFQDFALLPHLTILGNVAFPLKIQGMPRRLREARALEIIELVGLGGRENYYPHELSGGQQQRVGIARSLTTEPHIWFLDEPFSALDPLIRQEMQDEFLRLQKLLQKTIVFITHDFDEAVYLADRIAIMQDGRVVQVATPEKLIMNPATEYVAKFTRNISRVKVLSVGSVMKPPLEDLGGEAIAMNTMVRDIAERVLATDKPLSVVSPDGEIVGSIDRDTVVQVLLNRDAAR